MNNNLITGHDRYYRQILVKEIGGQGQQKLKKSKVLVIGAGGLGAPVLFYLAASGVGTLGVVDYDTVEMSNLQRQILYKTKDIGQIKVKAAKNTIKNLNPDVKINTYNKEIITDADTNILSEYDIIIDGSDSIKLKNLIARKCVKVSKTLVTGSASTWEGQLFIYDPNNSVSCYSCIYGNQSNNNDNDCSHLGIVGTVTGLIGSMMASETIKNIVGLSSSLTNNLFIYDGLFNEFRKIFVPKNTTCRSCNYNL